MLPQKTSSNHAFLIFVRKNSFLSYYVYRKKQFLFEAPLKIHFTRSTFNILERKLRKILFKCRILIWKLIIIGAQNTEVLSILSVFEVVDLCNYIKKL